MKKERDIKKKIFDIVQIGTRVDIPSYIFDYIIVLAVFSSITVVFLQTFHSMEKYYDVFKTIEAVTIIIFIVEYILRLYTCDLLYPRDRKWKSVLIFIFSFYGIVDFLTIVSYFEPLYSNGIVAFRMIRVMRIMKLFRVNQSIDAFSIVAEVIIQKKNQLMCSICMIFMIMLGASFCMYGFEHDVQPDVFENAFSGIWWATSTVLTVGYGDIYPITAGGRVAAIIIAILGVCVVAIPTGVISAGFVEYYARIKGDLKLSRDTVDIIEKRAKEKGKSANEYMLELIFKDKE